VPSVGDWLFDMQQDGVHDYRAGVEHSKAQTKGERRPLF
jgi:hypothetical protein